MLTLVPKIRKRAGCKEKIMQMLKDYVNISLFAAVIVDWVHWAAEPVSLAAPKKKKVIEAAMFGRSDQMLSTIVF